MEKIYLEQLTEYQWLIEVGHVKADEISVLGMNVAYVLDRTFGGLHNVRNLDVINWKNDHHIAFPTDKCLSTYDSNNLLALLVHSHDRMLRLEINSIIWARDGRPYTELVFHLRKKRTGEIYEMMPTIEGNINKIKNRLIAYE